MLVHVLIVLARSTEGFFLVDAIGMLTVDFTILVLGWFSFWPRTVRLDSVARRWYMRGWWHGGEMALLSVRLGGSGIFSQVMKA